MNLVRARNIASYLFLIWMSLQNTKLLIFRISKISPDRKQKKDAKFQQNTLQKILLCPAHDTIEMKTLSQDGEEGKRNTQPDFTASLPSSVLLGFLTMFLPYFFFNEGLKLCLHFLCRHLLDGFFLEYALLRDLVLPETMQQSGSATPWCYSWTQNSAVHIKLCLLLTYSCPKKTAELSTDLAVGIHCFRMTEMTQSFPSLENSLVNSHVRAKPIPSHQLKNNKLGFRKNVILGGLCCLCFWPFEFVREEELSENFSATKKLLCNQLQEQRP